MYFILITNVSKVRSLPLNGKLRYLLHDLLHYNSYFNKSRIIKEAGLVLLDRFWFIHVVIRVLGVTQFKIIITPTVWLILKNFSLTSFQMLLPTWWIVTQAFCTIWIKFNSICNKLTIMLKKYYSNTSIAIYCLPFEEK